ncbi:MAG: hypothetical protein ACM3JG_18930 [Thiohalocapsa sp.]
MRTTLTIEPDVAVGLKRLQRESDKSWKDVVNDTLRRGLQDSGGAKKKRKRFETKTFDCGRLLVDNVDNVWELLEQIEDHKFP